MEIKQKEMDKSWWACMIAGGASSRFFPLNKIMFDPVKCGRTLSQQAVDRLCGQYAETTVPPLDPKQFIVVTSKAFAPVLAQHIPEIPRDNFIGEPAPRSTLPAILYAMSHVKKVDPNGTMCVVTADHIISDTQTFRATLETARQCAQQNDCIVTIGIKPTTKPSDWIGFGAINSVFSSPIEIKDKKYPQYTIYPLRRFEEKPSVERAAQMIQENESAASSTSSSTPSSSVTSSSSTSLAWTWNAGMFVFRVPTMEKALQQFHPSISASYNALCAASTKEEEEKTFLTFQSKIPNPLNPSAVVDCSIDYAVMMPLTTETSTTHSLSACVISGAFPWFDVGGWSAFRTVAAIPQDTHSNIRFGNALLDGATKRCICVAEEGKRKIQLNVQNIDNHVVILSQAGTLVIIPDEISQRLKQLKETADKSEPGADVFVESEGVEVEREAGAECRVCVLGISHFKILVKKDPGSDIELSVTVDKA
ncbi:Mannosyl-oligosaccharide 1,2-alpha-mannosidase [Monocercomonoides exilis]|uniref:Mannosyl-oligosaccharide 1,2-alpha-mannosidase n=1 Tax=Monocercomonoides exilis TaxID=2049356 RepID=UPI003559BC01|nr:Mannosyl-oligosaccharide 1,2-alpha-mannosidase [Monocercomonoides exilis]|eukprot:MONOS_7411.1-p1 / transcript=MONOS_7411.1 / gene=MONOS_7411 / organism=Monocercomonoides_exilis_PA203 / gene_product=mannose-1-phosphate guanylyltransferase / transcript_product=mannose-1-phosphate guanylyltransferase / location=Mono_scaffold00252:47164-48971(-) / protein_length=479 / sequence_SO=supercontig / SO=protein_coding / is_pseudo=false